MTAHHLSNNSPGLPYTFSSHKFSRTNWFPVSYSEPFFLSLFSENPDSGPLHIFKTFYPVFIKINAFFFPQEGFLSPYPLNSFHTNSAIQRADTVHWLNEQNNWSLQNTSVKLLYNLINHHYTPLLQNKHVGFITYITVISLITIYPTHPPLHYGWYHYSSLKLNWITFTP